MIAIVVLNHLLKTFIAIYSERIYTQKKSFISHSFFLVSQDKYVLTEIIMGPSCLCIHTCFIHSEIMFIYRVTELKIIWGMIIKLMGCN